MLHRGSYPTPICKIPKINPNRDDNGYGDKEGILVHDLDHGSVRTSDKPKRARQPKQTRPARDGPNTSAIVQETPHPNAKRNWRRVMICSSHIAATDF